MCVHEEVGRNMCMCASKGEDSECVYLVNGCR
jgi:hypothetical protein